MIRPLKKKKTFIHGSTEKWNFIANHVKTIHNFLFQEFSCKRVKIINWYLFYFNMCLDVFSNGRDHMYLHLMIMSSNVYIFFAKFSIYIFQERQKWQYWLQGEVVYFPKNGEISRRKICFAKFRHFTISFLNLDRPQSQVWIINRSYRCLQPKSE